ncbi:hypothetical protein K4L06_18320 [Lysobacter sp. BMK333-48F3]|uniref:hypothetical protein n=1 Tax=Lysobacter sp. BMK333-48F3 TaxID=2867962 RepID=UPI001C8B9C3C|nr:hypothetical protein [Lysobacter sp. BMK333-48F3]MBX9403271.1 hypothetical protein [Lysobacter sp. BMK333-48F3]
MSESEISSAGDAGASRSEQWWLATLGRTVIWARLRVREAGTAEVFDSDGNTLPYDSEDTARAALMDAEFVELDGLDEDDAQARGFALAELAPPRAGDDEGLAALMIQKLPQRH